MIGFALNTGFVIAEAAYGFIANSLALLADAGHNLGDVLGLLLAWAAAVAGQAPAPSARFTYGMRARSILASLANADAAAGGDAARIVLGGRPAAAATRRRSPRPTVIWVALVGIVVNGVTALVLHGAAARTTSTSAAPSCTWRPMPRSRSASS